MNKILYFIISTIILITVAIAGTVYSINPKNGESITKEINRIFNADADEYLHSIKDFQKTANSLSDESDVEQLQSQFLKLREKYKRIEILVEYFNHEFVKDFINGAPLPSLERNTSKIVVLQPEGIQVIDELVFGENPIESKDEILNLTEKLDENSKELIGFVRNLKLEHRNIIEAGRLQLIRHFTLGVTGFDTPGSVNAIQDAIAVMETLKEYFTLYNDDLNQADKDLHSYINAKLEGSIKYLNDNQDFDDFDRLSYLKNYVNPLFKSMLELQRKFGIETVYEVTDIKQPVNHLADNLFMTDLVSPHIGSQVGNEYYTEEIIDLGMHLFFDPILSANNERACASCHDPQLAFTDGQKKSLGFDFEGTLSRNAPTLVNSVYTERYFLDLRVEVLEKQFVHVITNEKEFNTTLKDIFEKLSQSPEYVEKFKSAFPKHAAKPINNFTFTVALSTYIKSLRGFNSKFDKYVRNEIDEIDPAVKRGFNLFMGKAACGTCHFAPTFNGSVPPLFTDAESEVLGTPGTPDKENPYLDSDLGRLAGLIPEQSEIYRNSFKTVTVRNIELTAPYMHNGVYATLEEVMDFYNNGGGIGLGLDVPNQTLPPDSLHLTQREIDDIIAFMNALTDTSGMTTIPEKLPTYQSVELNKRKIGGKY